MKKKRKIQTTVIFFAHLILRAHIKRMILQKAINLREKKAIAVKRAEAQRTLHAKIRGNYESVSSLSFPDFLLELMLHD